MSMLMPLGMLGHLPEYEYVSVTVGVASVVLSVILLVVDVIKGSLVDAAAFSVTFSKLSFTSRWLNDKIHKQTITGFVIPHLKMRACHWSKSCHVMYIKSQ